jgi:hypothetical protein
MVLICFIFLSGEFPSFANGSTDDDSSQVHGTTVNTIPIMWGPPKRK